MAAGAAGTELCPHCGRPFKRLRAHLPHCKAAPAAPAASPGPGPGSTARPVPSSARGSAARPSPASAPGAAPRSNPQPSATSGSAPEPSPAPHPRPAPGTGPACPGTDPAAPGSGPDAVQDVARSLDLHPEEVEDVPQRLREGVKVVIEKHRARVVREKEPRSRGERTEPGPAPRKSAPKSRSKEAPSQGAAGSGSSKGGKGGLKATKTLREPAESSDSPGELVQKKGRDKSRAGAERVQMETGVGSEPPVCALHPRSLRLAPAEPIGAHGWGTAGNELGLPGLWGTAVPEPTVSTAPGLALQTQPVPSPGTAPGLALQTQPVPSPGTAPGLALQTQPVPSPGTAPGLALPPHTPNPAQAEPSSAPHTPNPAPLLGPGLGVVSRVVSRVRRAQDVSRESFPRGCEDHGGDSQGWIGTGAARSPRRQTPDGGEAGRAAYLDQHLQLLCPGAAGSSAESLGQLLCQVHPREAGGTCWNLHAPGWLLPAQLWLELSALQAASLEKIPLKELEQQPGNSPSFGEAAEQPGSSIPAGIPSCRGLAGAAAEEELLCRSAGVAQR